MTTDILGSAYIEIVARTGKVEGQVRGGLKSAESAAQVSGNRMGAHIADGMEKGTARVARSGRLLGDVFVANSASALGPLQEVVSKVDLIGAAMEQTRTKAGGMLLGIGAAATGVGAFLLTLQSREQGAHNQLAAAITAQGKSIDDYEAGIGRAVKSGEHLGQSGNQTIDAITTLTLALHDPKKALDDLGIAENVAASRHVALAAGARIVAQAYNGNTRVLKQFGVDMTKIVDTEKLVGDAHKASTKATNDVAAAQKAYTDKLAIYQQETHHSLAGQIALKDAHDKLTRAQIEQARAQDAVRSAQAKANELGTKGEQVLRAVAKTTAGQAAGAADTFVGHLKAIGAVIEDNASKMGGKAGKALVEFGPALAAGGFLIESGLLPRIGRAVGGLLGLGGQAAATATEVEVADAAEVASLDTVVVAIRELQTALTGIGPVAEAQAVEVGAATTAMDAEIAGLGTAAVGAAAEVEGIGAAAALAMPEVVALAGVLVGAYEAWKWLKGLENSPTPNFVNSSGYTDYTGANDPKSPQNTGKPGLAYNPSTGKYEMFDPNALAGNTSLLGSGSDYGPGSAAGNAARNAASAGNRAAAKAAGKTALDKEIERLSAQANQSVDEYLKANGLGPLANSALSKQITDAQKVAADNARSLGATVTAGMRAQVATVKSEISGLNAELKKMSDLRGAVVGQATSFTALGSLLPDNSLATAGGLVAAEVSRVNAEKLFGKNIDALRHRGLNKGAIEEILREGPQGRALASALVAGTDAQIQQLNAAEAVARQQGQVLGATAVNDVYGPGSQARANAELATLNRQVAVLNKQIAAQPALIAKAVDQARKNDKVTATHSGRTTVPR